MSQELELPIMAEVGAEYAGYYGDYMVAVGSWYGCFMA